MLFIIIMFLDKKGLNVFIRIEITTDFEPPVI